MAPYQCSRKVENAKKKIPKLNTIAMLKTTLMDQIQEKALEQEEKN